MLLELVFLTQKVNGSPNLLDVTSLVFRKIKITSLDNFVENDIFLFDYTHGIK